MLTRRLLSVLLVLVATIAFACAYDSLPVSHNAVGAATCKRALLAFGRELHQLHESGLPDGVRETLSVRDRLRIAGLAFPERCPAASAAAGESYAFNPALFVDRELMGDAVRVIACDRQLAHGLAGNLGSVSPSVLLGHRVPRVAFLLGDGSVRFFDVAKLNEAAYWAWMRRFESGGAGSDRLPEFFVRD